MARSFPPSKPNHRGLGLALLVLSSTSLARSGGQPTDQCVPPCDCDVLPVESPLGYSLRGTRCEGKYRKRIASSQTGLQLASFTVGPREFDVRASQSVQVTWKGRADKVYIRAQPVAPDVYYRMDAELVGQPHRFEWPTGVMRASAISSRKIGTTAWTIENGRVVYLPLFFEQKAANEPSAFKAVVVPAYAATELAVTILDQAGRILAKSRQKGTFACGQGVELSIEAVHSPDVLQLSMEAQWRAGGTKVSEVSFRTP